MNALVYQNREVYGADFDPFARAAADLLSCPP